MSQISGYKVLASSGNLPVYPGGQPLYAEPTNPFGKPQPLVPAGQYVFFDPMRNESLGLADIPTRELISIGVGVGPIPGGVSESIRSVAYDMVDLCHIQAATAEPPRCPGTPKVRVLFECVTCHDDVAIKVRWRNNTTENSLERNQWDEFTHFAKEICATCGGCTTPDVSNEVACKLVASGEEQAYKYGKEGSWGYLKKPLKPYTMRRIRANETTTQYCINPSANACSNCIVVPAITGISINNVITSFTGTTNPANPSQTFLQQVDRIVTLINAALESTGGRASQETGAEKNTCCPIRLNISSCHPIELLGENNVPLVPCATFNPNLSAPYAAQCKDCTIPPATRTYLSGVEIEFHLDPNECSCYPDLQGKSSYGIEYDIEVFGVPVGSYTIVEDQAGVYPENFGFQWLVKEMGQEIGGMGREEAYYNTYATWYGQPLKDSKQLALMSECATPYCSFIWRRSIPQSNISVAGDMYGPRWVDIFLVPSTDAVTLESFQNHFNAANTANRCPAKTNVTCWNALTQTIVDQDQDETQPNISGRIISE